MCRSTPKPKSIDGWSLPSAYHVIGGLGLAALLAVTPGWHEVTLHSHWALSFTSAGARGGRLVARPAFLDDRAVITVAHAPADAAEAPTRLLLRRRDGSARDVAGPGGALAVITAANGTWVAAADVFGSVALYDAELNRRWLCPALFHAAQAHVALTLRGDFVYVATAPFDAPPKLFRLSLTTGAVASEHRAVEPSSPPSHWPSAWRSDFYWNDGGDAADGAYLVSEAEALVRRSVPFSWIRAEDTRIEVTEEDVVVRGPRGLHAIEGGLFAPLPADALVLDDQSIVTLKAVDADRPAPRHKRSRDGGSVVAPCALIGIRGLPPVERHVEASLCHDRGIERTARDKIGRDSKRRSAVHSNMLLLDGGDVIIAASRGVVSRIRRDGSHAWQARRGPHWRQKDFGGYVVRVETGVLIVGAAEARLYDLDSGALLAHVDVPAFWDDERVQQAPVVSERGDVVLVATQFQTVALKVKVRRDAGAATAKLLVLALAAGAVGLVWLASAELDH